MELSRSTKRFSLSYFLNLTRLLACKLGSSSESWSSFSNELPLNAASANPSISQSLLLSVLFMGGGVRGRAPLCSLAARSQL